MGLAAGDWWGSYSVDVRIPKRAVSAASPPSIPGVRRFREIDTMNHCSFDYVNAVV